MDKLTMDKLNELRMDMQMGFLSYSQYLSAVMEYLDEHDPDKGVELYSKIEDALEEIALNVTI